MPPFVSPPVSAVFWNKLGSDAEVENSELGPDGVITGTLAYAPGKFGNGVDSPSNVNYPTFANAHPIGQSIAEFYWKPGYASTSAVASDIYIAAQFPLVADAAVIYHRTAARTFEVQLYDTAIIRRTEYQYNFAFTAGTIYHVLVIIDSAAGATNRIKVYIDGLFKVPFNFGLDGAWNPAGSMDVFISAPWLARNTNAVHDDLKIYNNSTTDLNLILNNIGVEGWPEVADTGIVVPKLTNPKIYVMGIDIFEQGKVKKLPVIEYYKTLNRDKVFPNELLIEADNSESMFSLEHSHSMFGNQQWRYSPLEIYDRYGIRIWNGELTNVQPNYNNNTSKISSRSILYKWRNVPVVFDSGGSYSPATDFRSVCDAIGFTAYNEQSIANSEAKQQAEQLLITTAITASHSLTFQQVIEMLADYGCADIYEYDGELYYDHWQYYTGGVSRALDRKDLIGKIGGGWPITDLVNEYRINHIGMGAGVPMTDATGNNIASVSRARHGTVQLKLFSGEDVVATDAIRVSTAIAVKYLGECYLRRSHRNLNTNPESLIQISFDLKIENRFWIDLKSYFTLEWGPEEWVDKVFEVFKIKRDENKGIISVVAYELASE